MRFQYVSKLKLLLKKCQQDMIIIFFINKMQFKKFAYNVFILFKI